MMWLAQFISRLTTRKTLMLSWLGVFVPSLALAQHGPSRHAPVNPSSYDVGTVITFSGTVSQARDGGAETQHLLVNVGADTVQVHLGPTAFLIERMVEIRVGDSVEVTGSRVMIGESRVVLAREIRKGNDTWALRETSGQPLWSPRAAKSKGIWTPKTLMATALAVKVIALVAMLRR